MRITEHSLGRVIAYLNHQQSNGALNIEIPADEASLLKVVSERAESVDTASLLNGTFSRLLEHESLAEPESLQTTIDFYLAIFNQPTIESGLSPEQSEKLILYLNNHYHFFERFTDVLRGYHRAMETLQSSN